MSRVLILDACQRSALSVTRSLGRQDIFVVTADETLTSLAGSSRFSEAYETYPPPGTNPERFIRSIAKLIDKWNIQLVLPMTELTSMLLQEYRSSLPEITLPFPEIGIVDLLADKISLMRLAQSLNIPTPNSCFIDNPLDNQTNFEDLTYPIVLKPAKSWININDKWVRRGVRYSTNPSAAKNMISTDPAFQTHPFMIQEYVQGQGKGIFALYNHGKAVAFFAHRRLREKPPQGGVSVLSESVICDPELLRYAKSLLDEAGWHGVAMVEFKGNDGETPYLMEINTRFWGSLQLAIDCGVDFPWMLYKIANGETVNMTGDYKIGKRLRWLLGDLDCLYLILRDHQVSYRSKMAAILKFITPAPFKTRQEVNRWSDISPFWWELRKYVKDLLP